ncbi:MAG: hypothetical protein ACE5IW_04200 [bacterium]
MLGILTQLKKFYNHLFVDSQYLSPVYLLITIYLIFSVTQCSFNKPSAPSWDLDVTVPLISKVFTMAEIAEDESSVIVDSTGLLALEFESELDTFYVGDELTIDPIQESYKSVLGSFSVDAPGSESTSMELRDIFDEADVLNGTRVVVPPFNFATASKPLEPYTNFEYVVIDTGNIKLRVFNNLAIPLGYPLTLEIREAISDSLVLSTTDAVRTILPGESAQFLISLSGKRIPNAISIRLSGASPGSAPDSVWVDANSSFAVEAEISDLLVLEAKAKIPSQMVSRQDNIMLTDSLVVTEAIIESGEIQMSFGGTFPLAAWIIFELPDFQSSVGSVLLDSVFITPNATEPMLIDLTDHTLRPIDQTANFGEQNFQVNWTVKTIDTDNQIIYPGGQFVEVRSSDFVNAEIVLDEIQLSRVTGMLGNQNIEITQDDIEFDIPADLDSIFFETAMLELYINNGVNFPATIDFTIEGLNESGASSELHVTGDIEPAPQPGVQVTSVIVVDQQNSNISEFLSILPTLIRVSGQVKLGDESWVGTVSKHDYVNGNVKIRAPLSLRLPPQTIESDVNELDIDEDTRADIEDNLSSGGFSAEIENHLPLGADVEFVFSQDGSTIFQNPILQIGPIGVDAGFLDSSGFVKKALVAEINLDLTEDEMRTFLKTPLYAALRVSVAGTNGQFVQIRESDYIEIKSYGKIKLKINQD